MNKIQEKALQHLVSVMDKSHETFIKPLYTEDVYNYMDFSGIGEVANWEAMPVYHDDDDEFFCEIDDHYEQGFSETGKGVEIHSSKIANKYAFNFIESGEEIAFYVLSLNDGTHYVGDYCGD